MKWIYFVAAINLLAFAVMFYDKRQAEQNQQRIPEKSLLLLAFFLGGLGIYAGMNTFRHKTQKVCFKYGIPLLVLWNVWLFWILYEFFQKYNNLV